MANALNSPHDSIDRVAADVAACRVCPRLVEWREGVAAEKRAAFREWEYWGRGVPGFGDERARIVVVGLAPAAHGANRTGRMFTGDRSGDWLYGALHRAGLASQPSSETVDDGLRLDDVYVMAAVRCAPPENKPTTEERDACAPFLQRELALLERARVFVALGSFGYQVLARELGLRPRPKFGHLVEARVDEGTQAERVVLCSFHPSQRNTFTGKLTEEMFDAVFARARFLAGLKRG